MKYMPITLIFTLVASLLMALIFVPTLGAIFGKVGDDNQEMMDAIKASEEGDISQIGGFTGTYAKILSKALHAPGLVVSGAIGTLIASWILYGVFGAGVELFPDIEPEQSIVRVHARGNLSVEEKDNFIKEVENQVLDTQDFETSGKSKLTLKKQDDTWKEVTSIPLSEKGPHRNGGFKDAFRNNLILVYATRGNKTENEWYYNRARVDAEMFYYRANGNVEMISDREFDLVKYADRNVIIYGNASNNTAWNKLLSNCPLQVKNGSLTLGNKTLDGDNYGSYFIYKRNDSSNASVGVVTATGSKGMKAAYANHYLVNGTTFPDVLIFNENVLLEGILGVECSGFFGNNWSYETGDFEWRK
jgi:hypothetical protein